MNIFKLVIRALMSAGCTGFLGYRDCKKSKGGFGGSYTSVNVPESSGTEGTGGQDAECPSCLDHVPLSRVNCQNMGHPMVGLISFKVQVQGWGLLIGHSWAINRCVALSASTTCSATSSRQESWRLELQTVSKSLVREIPRALHVWGSHDRRRYETFESCSDVQMRWA